MYVNKLMEEKKNTEVVCTYSVLCSGNRTRWKRLANSGLVSSLRVEFHRRTDRLIIRVGWIGLREGFGDVRILNRVVVFFRPTSRHRSGTLLCPNLLVVLCRGTAER